MSGLSFQEKYQIIEKKDSSFEGIFYTGVKTTGIFCRPSCRARKPNPENVIFFNTTRQALQHGFRPCKICKPLEHLDNTPPEIKSILDEIQKQPDLRIKDNDLQNRGVHPSKMRRWFQKHHQMTFQAYQRQLRINRAYHQLEQGKSVLESAFESGYESLSGFNDSYQSIFGTPPTNSEEINLLNIIRFTTPLGPMFACASESGLCLLEFTDRRSLERSFSDLRNKLNAVILPGTNPYLSQTKAEIAEYFQGTRKRFSVPLDRIGSDFQISAWAILENIPYGKTISYKEQAAILGKEGAVRAVGAANGKNRIAIIIPCHRVIGTDGKLVGYGGGLYRKKWLLEFEQKHPPR
jgi:AraC family transcriptional regulator of adaptative response/methylated-DNA-[protein]-cysteine methyltransferase